MQTTPARSRWLLLALIALQFALVNLATAPLFGDAARNLHWGLITAENPQFLFGAPDTYERIKGFPPDPPSLAEHQLYLGQQGSLHRWWGPLAPLLFALVWRLTGSYTLLQLVIPLVGGATVLLAYLLARDILGRRAAMLAAIFLACFPIFREYASTSYTEALSALVVTAALLAYRRGRLVATILLGALTILTKMDLYPLYAAAIVGAWVAPAPLLRIPTPSAGGASDDGRVAGAPHRRWFTLLALAAPVALAAPWIWSHYLGGGAGGPTRGMSGELFLFLAPQLLELLFYIPWYGALITLAAIGAAAWAGVRAGRFAQRDAGLLLGWLAAGLLIVLVYGATPGAGNSPRVIIPALPALAILFGGGFSQLAASWRRRIGFYLVVLFLLINLATVGYHAFGSSNTRPYQRAWEVLRSRPQGYVLTDRYWETILFSRHYATWFEADKKFETSIMQSQPNFARYLASTPIRYVLLPREGGLAAPEVRAFLDANAARVDAGDVIVYELNK
jgi:Dolichyl-phosphate-mannose-protein mannosyltransferase